MDSLISYDIRKNFNIFKSDIISRDVIISSLWRENNNIQFSKILGCLVGNICTPIYISSLSTFNDKNIHINIQNSAKLLDEDKLIKNNNAYMFNNNIFDQSITKIRNFNYEKNTKKLKLDKI